MFAESYQKSIDIPGINCCESFSNGICMKTLRTIALFITSLEAITKGKAVYEAAQKAYKMKQYEQAAEGYIRAAVLNPKKYKAVASYKAGLAYLKMHGCEFARKQFTIAIKADAEKGGPLP